MNLLDFGNQNLTAKDITGNDITVYFDGAIIKEYRQNIGTPDEYVKRSPALKIHYQVGGRTIYKDFVLNKANRDIMTSLGVTDTDALNGATIHIVKEFVKFADKEVAGLRIQSINYPDDAKASKKNGTKSH